MPAYIALLRMVNVCGTSLLPMTELKAMCETEGFTQVQTYIASGNVVFAARRSAAKVKAALEKRLQAHAGKPVHVAVRTVDEMAAALQANPSPRAPAKRVVAIFLDEPPPSDALDHARGQGNEEMRLGTREIYVRYGEDMGRSKLDIPAARSGPAQHEHDRQTGRTRALALNGEASAMMARNPRRIASLFSRHRGGIGVLPQWLRPPPHTPPIVGGGRIPSRRRNPSSREGSWLRSARSGRRSARRGPCGLP